MRSVGQIRPTPRGALSIQAPMHSSNGLTITCRPKRGWLSAQDFEALKKDGYGYNSTEFCKLAASRCFAGAGRRGEGALQDAYEDCKCVVTARAYFPLVNVHTGLCTATRTSLPAVAGASRWRWQTSRSCSRSRPRRPTRPSGSSTRSSARHPPSGLLLRGDG